MTTPFKSVRILKYRGLSEVIVDDLRRFNLFVGQCGTGKSSILEAVYLLAHGMDPDGRQLFRDDPFRDGFSLEFVDTRGGTSATVFSREPDGTRSTSVVTNIPPGGVPVVLLTPYLTTAKSARPPGKEIDPRIVSVLKEADSRIASAQYVMGEVSVTLDDGAELSKSYLSSGLQRILELGLLFEQFHGGIVLVDDLAMSLHPSIMRSLSRMLFELAVAHKVQVFFTTHSKEMVDAFIEDRKRAKACSVYLLKRESLQYFDGQSLARAVEVGDVDVRRL